MAQNYQKIGDYISVLDNRNTDGGITNLMGISIDKCYIPSVANVIGTDLRNYKVIRKSQFACSLMQVSRDQRIPLAMYSSDEPAIMSPAYVIFEVDRPDQLLPEYMELWFKRAEFDREASFYAVGGVRGSLDWEDFCKMKLPVKTIDEQRKIVRNYQIITDRIDLLRKINSNLQSIIDVDFERFYSENCNIETVLSSICTLTSSKRVFAEDYVSEGVPFYRGGEISLKKIGEPIEDPLFISREHFESIKETYGIPTEGDILITAVGTIGNSYLVENEEFYFKDGNIIWIKDFTEPEYRFFVYDYLQSSMFRAALNSLYIGSTQIALTIVGLSGMKLNISELSDLQEYASRSAVIRKEIQRNQKELLELHNLRKLLLTKGA